MPDIFISYSREDKPAMEVVLENLRKLGFNVWVDVEHLKAGTGPWIAAIRDAIEAADVMVVLCSPISVESEWVSWEIRLAKLRHPQPLMIIPLWIAGEHQWGSIPAELIDEPYIDVRGQSGPERGFRQLVRRLAEQFSSIAVPDYDLKSTDTSQFPATHVINIAGHVEGSVYLIGDDWIEDGGPRLPSAARIWALLVIAALAAAVILLGTLIATRGITLPAGILQANPELPEQEAAGQLPELGPTAVSGEGAAGPAEPDAATPTSCPVGYSSACPVTTNSQWTPATQEHDGVEMALVPAGCFFMGSTGGESDERPVHQRCFEQPFWIDVYEVTNRQYGVAGCFSGHNDHPRECVVWSAALAHCEGREARLPTEAEWEYAARGPDGLIYPWGNVLSGDEVVYGQNSVGETVEVGSKPSGVSWVGAYDMSGNVAEWVSSIYRSYPYDTTDGREASEAEDDISARVMRGGTFVGTQNAMRAANRFPESPNISSVFVGFRCARSY